MKAILRRLQKLEGQLAVSKQDQAAAELLRERFRRYKEASGQSFEEKPRVDLGGARTITEILSLRFHRPTQPAKDGRPAPASRGGEQ
jgi:hypothetical protein